MKEASAVTFASSTPRCSTTIFLTLSAISLIGSATPAKGPPHGDQDFRPYLPPRGGSSVRREVPMVGATRSGRSFGPLSMVLSRTPTGRQAHIAPRDRRLDHGHAAIDMQRG